MPSSLAELDISEQFQIQQNDPELYSLLAGTAPAALEAAVLSGAWADAAPTAQQRQDEARQQRIAELVDQLPYGTVGQYLEDGSFQPGQPGNVTLQFELEALDPQLAARLKTAATPPATQQGLSQEQANWVTGEMLRNRYAAQQPTPAGAA